MTGIFGNLLSSIKQGNATLYAMLNPAWSLVSGPVSLLLIIYCLNKETQGYFYTFHSLVALKNFFELGLYLVIVNTASHEWAKLNLTVDGEITGDEKSKSRLISLGRFIFRWYSAVSFLFIVVVGSAGIYVMAGKTGTASGWELPWIALVLIYGMILWALPFNSLLEGCNQVLAVNKFRFYQAVLGTVAMWAALLIGAGLWAIVCYAAILLLRDLYLLFVEYKNFFKPFYHQITGPSISWKEELLPMQWRVAVSGLVNYFAYWLYTPVMFYFHGPVIAGKMGITWQVVNTLQLLGMAWINIRVPKYGMLIADRKYVELDRYWTKSSILSVLVVLLSAMLFLGFVFLINSLGISWSERLLGVLPTIFFLVGCIFMQISQCMSAYFRAHRQEPILVMSVTTSVLIGILVIIFGKNQGPVGASAVYMMMMIIVVIWESLIWINFRKKHH